MSSIWRWLLGIGRSPGEVAPGGGARLELTALPSGGAAVAWLVAAAVLAALRPNLDKLGRGREVFLYDLGSASRAGKAGASRTRRLDDLKPDRGVSPLGDALRDVLALHRGRPVAGVVLVTDGRSNAGEDPLRAAEAASRQGIPVYAIAARAEEGPRNVRLAEIEASPVV